ncbi:hypothetical protein GEMRC1_004883 [Eukaryota sp. GEM-RC1]
MENGEDSPPPERYIRRIVRNVCSTLGRWSPIRIKNTSSPRASDSAEQSPRRHRLSGSNDTPSKKPHMEDYNFLDSVSPQPLPRAYSKESTSPHTHIESFLKPSPSPHGLSQLRVETHPFPTVHGNYYLRLTQCKKTKNEETTCRWNSIITQLWTIASMDSSPIVEFPGNKSQGICPIRLSFTSNDQQQRWEERLCSGECFNIQQTSPCKVQVFLYHSKFMITFVPDLLSEKFQQVLSLNSDYTVTWKSKTSNSNTANAKTKHYQLRVCSNQEIDIDSFNETFKSHLEGIGVSARFEAFNHRMYQKTFEIVFVPFVSVDNALISSFAEKFDFSLDSLTTDVSSRSLLYWGHNDLSLPKGSTFTVSGIDYEIILCSEFNAAYPLPKVLCGERNMDQLLNNYYPAWFDLTEGVSDNVLRSFQAIYLL